jgi:hypothetical protein
VKNIVEEQMPEKHAEADYVNGLELQGRKTFTCNANIWAKYTEAFTVARTPAFVLSPVTHEEISEVFQALHPAILTYAVQARQPEEGNGYLYVTTNKGYDIEKLDKNGRRDARRALRNYSFRFIGWDHLLKAGYKAYHDTRSRNGLSDHTQADFNALIAQSRIIPPNTCLAAIDEQGIIGGFLIMTMADDWIEVSGAYSDTGHLQNCPNNGMFHYLQEKFLATGIVTTISYGYSSVQTGSSIDGLHHFKQRIGFDAVPIRRYFILKPSLRFLVNPVSLFAIKSLLKMFPSNRALKKIEGIFKFVKP